MCADEGLLSEWGDGHAPAQSLFPGSSERQSPCGWRSCSRANLIGSVAVLRAQTFCRKFAWHELMLWPEDMPRHALVVLSHNDDLVPSPLVAAHLAQARPGAAVLYHPSAGHGGFLLDLPFQAQMVQVCALWTRARTFALVVVENLARRAGQTALAGGLLWTRASTQQAWALCLQQSRVTLRILPGVWVRSC